MFVLLSIFYILAFLFQKTYDYFILSSSLTLLLLFSYSSLALALYRDRKRML